jgi:hypothetical protein
VLLIAGAQIRAVSGSWGLLGATAAVFIAFAVVLPFLARFVARGVLWRAAFRSLAMFCIGRRPCVRVIVELSAAFGIPAQAESVLSLPFRQRLRGVVSAEAPK